MQTGRRQGQEASIGRHRIPVADRKPTMLKQLLAGDEIPASYQDIARSSAVFLRVQKTEDDQGLAVVGQVHRPEILMHISQLGVVQLDYLMAYSSVRVVDPQLLIHPCRIKPAAVA